MKRVALAILLCANPAFARPLDTSGLPELCATASDAAIETIGTRAQETVPLMLRHGFDEVGFGHAGLSMIVAIPQIYTPSCPHQILAPIDGLETLDDSTLRGWIMAQSALYPLTEEGQPIVFTSSAIVDWRYQPVDTAQGTFGHYAARDDVSLLSHDEPDLLPLAVTIIPENWN